jgi:hypothetical protein
MIFALINTIYVQQFAYDRNISGAIKVYRILNLEIEISRDQQFIKDIHVYRCTLDECRLNETKTA